MLKTLKRTAQLRLSLGLAFAALFCCIARVSAAAAAPPISARFLDENDRPIAGLTVSTSALAAE